MSSLDPLCPGAKSHQLLVPAKFQVPCEALHVVCLPLLRMLVSMTVAPILHMRKPRLPEVQSIVIQHFRY